MGSAIRSTGGLEGKAILVTGGGTGIGHACAAQLASDGAAVTICGRTEAKLTDSVERIESVVGHGGSIQHIVAEPLQRDRESWMRCAEAFAKLFEQIA